MYTLEVTGCCARHIEQFSRIGKNLKLVMQKVQVRVDLKILYLFKGVCKTTKTRTILQDSILYFSQGAMKAAASSHGQLWKAIPNKGSGEMERDEDRSGSGKGDAECPRDNERRGRAR